MSTPETITDPAGVDAVVREARAEGRVAIDLEFLWERTYAPIACLAQLATPVGVHLVDPIEGAPLGPIAELVADPDVEVVMHAPSADLTLLGMAYGIRPQALHRRAAHAPASSASAPARASATCSSGCSA